VGDKTLINNMKEYEIQTKIKTLVKSKFRRLKSLYLYGRPRFPEGITIETATFCNRTCEHCGNSTNPFGSQVYVSNKVYSKFLERILEMKWTGTVTFNFNNEPLLDPYLVPRIALARSLLPTNRLVVYTNGDFLTIEKMGAFVKAGLSEMWVCDHNNPIMRPKEVQPGWHERINAIEQRYPKHVVLRGTVDDKPWLVPMGGASKPEASRPRTRCEDVYGYFMVLYDGNVNLCSCEASRRFIQGNIMENSILDIWKHSRLLKVREGVGQGSGPMLPSCELCLKGNTAYK
jgi:MoaA/NifB/PqqE/SkfB family radical SAM enzyme